MALKIPAIPTSFPIFSPATTTTTTTTHRPSSTTELRFSRWNNANAEPFNRRRRSQEQIERDLRLHRCYQSLTNLTDLNPNSDSASSSTAVDFKSNGTPSSPSPPSIPGKRSKYSKPLSPNPNSKPNAHPAFRRQPKPRFSPSSDPENGIVVTEKGISYSIKNAPFEFQYSYTETPKVKPLALREQPYLPFGPGTMPRPWTGRKPLPESKKKLPEFDSFKLPPAGKKGVKPVQAPGPYLMGSGPRERATTREEVLGEPLTAEEVKELIKGCLRTRRQLNMGRDGLTHNMLDNIHALWKRRRVCKIKCKGVCTVDMDNVCQQLEEKTGGKIIYCKGGVIYLFRGRNYNYRTRPRFPLMLWKPAAPVYPRLVQRVPEGLTLEEATEMRKRGRQLPPICKLGKNGVYVSLVKNVKEAFEACELVRINCQDMNKSDVRKIGAKLKDLVPCVLVSFEYEHILMWRGKEWTSSFPPPEENHVQNVGLTVDDSRTTSSISDLKLQESEELLPENNSNSQLISTISSEITTQIEESRMEVDLVLSNESSGAEDIEDPSKIDRIGSNQDDVNMIPSNSPNSDAVRTRGKCLEEVMLLLRQAVENGSAVILDDEPLPLDANAIYERSVTLAKSARAGPIFRHKIRKVAIKKTDKKITESHEEEEVETEPIISSEIMQEKKSRSRREYFKGEAFSEVIPRGSLRVDELAKLLA